jgi:tetratricopeptide (TPR) repeat protein
LNLHLRTISGFLAACCLYAAAAPDSVDRAKVLRRTGKLSEARHVLEPILADPATASPDRAAALLEISQIDLAEGHYPQAISNGTHAAEVYRTVHDRSGEGFGLTITALAHMYAGAYSESIRDIDLALTIARETHDAASEVTRLNNAGTVYYFEGDYAAAMRRYEEAMRIVDARPGEPWNLARRQLTTANIATVYQRLGQYDRAISSYSALRTAGAALAPAEQAQVLSNMGALYRRLGDPAKALETYRAAQALYRKQAMRNGEIAVLNNVGIVQALDLALYPEALSTFDDALAMARNSGDRPVELHSLLYRAETLFRMKKPRESQEEFSTALQLADQLHANEESWKALYGLARIEAGEGHADRATVRLRKAVSLIESLRSSGPATLRGGFLADKRQVYDLLIALTLSAAPDKTDDLFWWIEHTHARSIQDEKRQGVTASLNTVRTKLSPGTLLLEYWVGDDSVAVIWADSNAAGVRSVAAGSDLRARLRDYAKSIPDPQSADWKPKAEYLGHLLLNGVPALATAKHIVIVPDRELSMIPFETIPVPGRAVRLIDCCDVAYLPTAVALGGPSQARRVWPFWRTTLLGFANPKRGSGADPLNISQVPGTGLLPSAERELSDVSRALGGVASAYTGAGARKEYLTGMGPLQAPVLHLATHAMSDSEDSARSYILFAPSRSNDAFDYLFLKGVTALDLRKVDLVTLSACDSAQGKMVEGEGVQSFNAAFLGAGAKAVVASLWPVSDTSTARFMHDFYSQLALGMTAAESLRFAKRHALESGQTHPFFWAGFILTGDATLQMPRIIPAWAFIFAALTLTGAILLALKFRTAARPAEQSRRSH